MRDWTVTLSDHESCNVRGSQNSNDCRGRCFEQCSRPKVVWHKTLRSFIVGDVFHEMIVRDGRHEVRKASANKRPFIGRCRHTMIRTDMQMVGFELVHKSSSPFATHEVPLVNWKALRHFCVVDVFSINTCLFFRCWRGRPITRAPFCQREYFNGLCGSKCFQSDHEVCCDGVIQPRLLGNECCGSINYKLSEGLCCNGKFHKVRPAGRSGVVTTSCCGQEVSIVVMA